MNHTTLRSQQMEEALRQAGYRMTPQRLAICEVLAGSADHPTPYSVFDQVRERFPTVSRATVYNTLNALRDLGEIVEIGLGRSETHYEPNLAPHANLICLRCGRIVDYDGLPLQELGSEVAADTGFDVKNTRLEVFGICDKCQRA
ncbi:MAG: Fur family transcriptional regulator [Chloroflexota bacterium]|nr:Fur family transcriptional regulator [Chloroflexota bacterium]